jgi:TRAP-type C4-dicarboxylate transport system permease small subunit
MSDDGHMTAELGPDPVASPELAEQHGLGEETTPELLPAREPFRTVLHALGIVEQVGGVALVIVILALVIVQVAQRYVPLGWAWTGEIARYSMVWATFVMAGYLMAHDGQIAIKVVDLFLPARALGIVLFLGHVVVAATSVVLAYATIDFIANDRGQVTAAAEIPLAIVFAIPAVGFVLSALRAVLALFVQDLPEVLAGKRAGA